MMTTSDLTPDELRARLHKLGLHGLLAQWDEIGTQPWVRQLIAIEEAERQRRSLARRLDGARLGAFKPIADFDWGWPRKIDRQAVDELFGLGFIPEATNIILVGPNGVGKTMLLKNLAYQAILHGYTVRLTSASDMLADLAAQDSSAALARRLRRYNQPQLLCVDEVGYLSYSSRYADLLFEVVTRRYDANRPILLSTNKAFNDWAEVFPHATCTVTLVDRLVHRSEILEIDGDSYRLKEAKERQLKRSSSRRTKTPKP
jgi:DNA replication protein DnaC